MQNYLSKISSAYLWLALIAIAITEIMVVSMLVDARGILLQGAASKLLYYAGDLLKWGITASAIFILFASKNLQQINTDLIQGFRPKRLFWIIPIHLCCFVMFLWFTAGLFGGFFASNNIHLIVWLLLTLLTATTFFLIVSSPKNILKIIRQYWFTILISLLGSLLVLLLSIYSRAIWYPLSSFTLYGSHILLDLIYSDIYIDAPNMLLGANDFIVHVSQQCSGIDGMALSAGITSAYLFFSRKHLSFPNAFFLIPIAIALSLLFNLLRVAVLIAIGASFSERIAIEGFHSVAGWIVSVIIAILIIFVFSSWKKFQRQDTSDSGTPDDSDSESMLASAILWPFVLFLALTLVAGIFNSDFDYLYTVKIIIPMIALGLFWSRYSLKWPKNIAEPLLIGLVVAILWVVLIPVDTEANLAFESNLTAIPSWLAVLWVISRCIGFWIFAPVVEELVFRGYLLNRLSGKAVFIQGKIAFSLVPFILTSVLFAAIHTDWLPGVIAGALFALSRYRSNTMTSPIIAHASANIFIALWTVLYSQNWIAI